jgi:hypothetical protein
VFRLHSFLRLVAVTTLLCLACSCNKQPANLAQIQQQRAGDYLLTLLNDTGSIKQHSNRLVLEVRTAATNQLTNVNNLQIQGSMRMPGMGPMFATLSPTRQLGVGQYEFDADFSMSGQWSFLVTFEPNGRVQFNVSAQ